MRNPLKKRFLREIRNNLGRYAAILIIFIVMVAIISSFLVVSNGVRLAYENDRVDNFVEDGQFSAAAEIPSEIIKEAEKLGVSVYSNYYLDSEVLSGQMLRLYELRSDVNIQTVWEGKLPENDGEIAIDRLFGEKHELSVGDSISFSGRELKISALVSLPDYSALFIKNTDLMMDPKGFGVAIVTPELFDSFASDDMIYNYAYRYDDRDMSETERVDFSDEMKESLIENGAQLTGFIMMQDNQSISFVSDDMGSDVPMMKAFLYIIQIIMAFVFTVIITSSVESEAAVIGTLLAAGYKKSELVRHYLTLPVLVILIGAVIGNILSYTAGLPLFKDMYYGAYSLPPMVLRLNIEALLLTTLLPVIFVLALNILVLRRKLSLSPIRFLRRDLRRNRQKRAPALPEISFVSRFRIRVILQNIGSYIMLFFGIMFAGFILLFGLCMRPTVENYVSSIESAAVSEYQYITKMPFLGDVDGEGFSMHSLEVYYPQGDRYLEISFYGVPEESEYWDIDTGEIGRYGVILSDGLSKKLGAGVGGVLIFTDPYNQEEYTLTVKGIKEYPAGFVAFMELGEMNRILEKDSDYISGYLSDTELDIPDEYIATIITPEEMSKLGDQMLSTFSDMSKICLGAAIVIYLVLMYILTKVIVDKNAMSISFMKVMGYQSREIGQMYLAATIIAVLLSLLISLPLIDLGLRFVFSYAFSRVNGYLEAYIPFYLLAAIVCVGFVSCMIINQRNMRRISRIGLAEVLKNRE